MFKQVFVDCMPGPTHHFGGHSIGNLPSMQSKNTVANPKKAALEWLEKVNAVRLTGAHQCILPPHPRPLWCHIKNPTLTELSSGFMWMANAGHFIPSIDTKINHHQFIPANMNYSHHRNKEHRFHRYWIKKITHDIPCTIHSPITANDEGAANGIRLWHDPNKPGIQLFVHGHDNNGIFPSRQKKESIDEIISILKPKYPFILKQKKMAIDHGVFHNDIISFGFHHYLFCHEHAFENQAHQLKTLNQYAKKVTKQPLTIIEISENELPLKEAVQSYLFNSQVIQTKKGPTLLCPTHIQSFPNAQKLLKRWVDLHYFNNIEYVSISSSLMNGGGPACLRLTLYLTPHQINAIPRTFWLTKERYEKIKIAINERYPNTTCINSIKQNPRLYRKIANSPIKL